MAKGDKTLIHIHIAINWPCEWRYWLSKDFFRAFYTLLKIRTVLEQYRFTWCPIFRANLFPKVTGSICRLPLFTFTCWSELIKLRDRMRLWVRYVWIGILIQASFSLTLLNELEPVSTITNFFRGTFSSQIHDDVRYIEGCTFIHGFNPLLQTSCFRWIEFQLIHWRRTENSPFAREHCQVSFMGYPWFLMYMYSII